jgi:hypothetical protein
MKHTAIARAGLAALGLVLCTNLHAIDFTNPLSLSQEGVVGTKDGVAGDTGPEEAAVAQAILNLTQGQVLGDYKANTAFDYSGVIDGSSAFKDADGIGGISAGWDYVLAKYDGQNAGYVLFYLGGEASTIPEFPYDLWTTNTTQYQISHYTLFNGHNVPDGGTTAVLLGLGLVILAVANRRRALI